MPEGHTGDPRFRMLHDPDDWECFPCDRTFAGRKHWHRGALFVALKVVKFIADFEGGGNASHDRVAGFLDRDLELAKFVVAPSPAADEDAVVFRPVLPVIP